MTRAPARPAHLAVSVAVSAILVLTGFFTTPSLTVPGVVRHLLFPLTRLTGFITIGLVAGQVIEGMGWTRQAAVLARPWFRFSRLGDLCSAAFTTAFISGTTANAMLAEFYDQGKITRLQLFLSNFINQFPAFFLHLPTTAFIILPLTGKAGAWYFLLTFLAVLGRTGCFLLVGRLWIPAGPSAPRSSASSSHPVSSTGPATPSQGTSVPASAPSDGGGAPSAGHHHPATSQSTPSVSAVCQSMMHRLPNRVMKIFTWVLPIYTLVFLLHRLGAFDWVNDTLAQSVTLHWIPVESLSVVILSFAAEFTSGFAAAGALMDAGVITVNQTVLALLAGNILAFPVRALRHQLPRYLGVFPPGMGIQVLLAGQLFRVISLVVVAVIFYLVTP